MKLAIQISGDFRTLHLSLPYVEKNVLSAFPNWEIDFFVHSWWREDDGLGTWDYPTRGHWHKSMVVFSHTTGLQLLNPKRFFIDKFEDMEELKALPRAYAMFYSILRANDARKEYEEQTQTKYDLVMRYRTDCILHENLYDMVKPFLSLSSFLCIPKPKRIVSFDGPVESDEYGICDWFAIGTSDTMDVYCGTYKTFIGDHLPLVPESMLVLQLKMHGIHHSTSLKRPEYDLFMIEGNGMIRGCVQTESKKS